MGFVKTIDNGIEPLRRLSNKALSPLLDLGIRLYMANIFFKSGKSKLDNYLNNDWGSTLFLFEEIHPIPGIPPNIAAIAGTGGEVILPVLLAFGLFGRFAAAGLLVITATIQFVVPADYGVQNPEHYMWMLLLAVPFLKGPGAISLDHLLLKFIRK